MYKCLLNVELNVTDQSWVWYFYVHDVNSVSHSIRLLSNARRFWVGIISWNASLKPFIRLFCRVYCLNFLPRVKNSPKNYNHSNGDLHAFSFRLVLRFNTTFNDRIFKVLYIEKQENDQQTKAKQKVNTEKYWSKLIHCVRMSWFVIIKQSKQATHTVY